LGSWTVCPDWKPFLCKRFQTPSPTLPGACLSKHLGHVPKKLKETVADDVRSIFYASSKAKALGFYAEFKQRWEKDLPSAVACLERSLESCLTYLQFPEEEWVCLRTTNVIERVNKEFKRRTRPMEILAGERSCYTLLAFVCLRMELRWRSKPIGKVPCNLPFMKKAAEKNFTKKILTLQKKRRIFIEYPA
jgi:putative transposase